jgi:hypothetical protein
VVVDIGLVVELVLDGIEIAESIRDIQRAVQRSVVLRVRKRCWRRVGDGGRGIRSGLEKETRILARRIVWGRASGYRLFRRPRKYFKRFSGAKGRLDKGIGSVHLHLGHGLYWDHPLHLSGY